MGKLGKDTTNLTTNIPGWLHEELKELAQASGMSVSAYMRQILTEAAHKRMAYRLTYLAENQMVSESQAPYNPTDTAPRRKPKGK